MNLPEAISTGAVNFEGKGERIFILESVFIHGHLGHDFFSAQPHQNVAIFILRYILHDWSDNQSLKILQSLRQAASENTKLLIIEFLLPDMGSTEASDEKILKFEGPAVRTYLADLVRCYLLWTSTYLTSSPICLT